MQKKLKVFLLYIFGAFLIIGGVIIAGTLTPESTPSPTGYTLEDIYNLVVNSATSTAGNHSLSTTTAPSPSMHSITDIYNELSTLIDPTKVEFGTPYLGKTGTLVSLSSIVITNPADKLSYTVGDPLDVTGLAIEGTYSDESTSVEAVATSSISGFNSSVPATGQVLTVSIGRKTTTYNVDIVVDPCPATGGTKTTSGDYCINTFTTVGEDSFVVPSGSISVDVLVVAGGGGGGSQHGGGGGGGGVILLNTSFSGSNLITIGDGGQGSLGVSSGNNLNGSNGQDSTVGNLTAIGGGGGGCARDPAPGSSGSDGGSGGGGGGGWNNDSMSEGGIGTVGQGFNGGGGLAEHPKYFGGGGGGASEIGETSSLDNEVAASGGDGVSSSISGTLLYYGGGGGASEYTTGYYGGEGGQGGGGHGGGTGVMASNGGINTGGGGGASPAWDQDGGNGGSGIVIVRYLKQI